MPKNPIFSEALVLFDELKLQILKGLEQTYHLSQN